MLTPRTGAEILVTPFVQDTDGAWKIVNFYMRPMPLTFLIYLGLLLTGPALVDVEAGTGTAPCGVVVDAETNQPIEGAVAVAATYEEYHPLSIAGGVIVKLYAVREALSDRAGRFELSPVTASSLNPLKSYYTTAEIAALHHKVLILGMADWPSAGSCKALVLSQLHTTAERERNLADLSSGLYLRPMWRNAPQLFRLMNLERVALGMAPMSRGTKGRQ